MFVAVSPDTAKRITTQSSHARVFPPIAGQSRSEPRGVQSPQALRQALEDINQSAKSLNSSVQFSLDTRAAQPVVRVVDNETGQLIRQIPSEEVLALREALDRIVGLLINHTA